MQAISSGYDDDARQILKYASLRPEELLGINSEKDKKRVGNIKYDVVVLVNSENDDIASEAIEGARNSFFHVEKAGTESPPKLAPIIVLGCHLDRESINGEWYKIKWREHHNNHRFSTPNICPDSNSKIKDLNALFTTASHHAVPVSRPALNRTGRIPFMNDDPPPIYVATRLIIPAINTILSMEDRDTLASTGKVEVKFSKNDILNSTLVQAMTPRPTGLGKWIESGLNFLATELKWRMITGVGAKEYIVNIDKVLIKGDLNEIFSVRAAKTEVRRNSKIKKAKKKSRQDAQGQLKLF